MNSVIKIFWFMSIATLVICLVLAYGYLPRDMVVLGFETSSISKSLFFNVFAVCIAVFFFLSRILQKGIREMNWAFILPFSSKWLGNPELRDRYRVHIESWVFSMFSFINFIFISSLFIIWGGNDRMVFSFQLVFLISLIVFITILILLLLIPPFLINRGPNSNNSNG